MLAGALAVVLSSGSTAGTASARPGDGSPFGSSNLGVGEYRVHKKLTLDLGAGARGGVEAVDGHCVNANGEFPFSMTSDAPQVHDLWIDASESFPVCITDLSSMVFRVYLTSPITKELKIAIGERPGGGYDIYCYVHVDDPSTYPLTCSFDYGTDLGSAITVRRAR
ncbi:hypothetical protein [Gordonia sp. OPL2]|uniref:hypothetical protein n=1 Tax=Gordonia sp. OPL2 TaxID=2486274 RepID=UPI0016555987|nr:hypothetical protein [Gordonia sp. OPL2]ROZ89137.1 hypothetical protein EEB19_18785 [Gordonia sp. OPL2]